MLVPRLPRAMRVLNHLCSGIAGKNHLKSNPRYGLTGVCARIKNENMAEKKIVLKAELTLLQSLQSFQRVIPWNAKSPEKYNASHALRGKDIIYCKTCCLIPTPCTVPQSRKHLLKIPDVKNVGQFWWNNSRSLERRPLAMTAQNFLLDFLKCLRKGI